MSRYFLILLISCAILIVPAQAQNQKEIQPNLEPGKVYNLDTLPRSWFDFLCPSRAFWGKNVSVFWLSSPPEATFPITSVQSEESLIYVIKGPLTIQTGKGKITLHDSECMLFKKGDQCILSSGPDSVELLEIDWPIMPVFVSAQYYKKPPQLAAIPPSSTSNLPPDSTRCFRKTAKLDLAPNLRGRLVQGERGQLCNVNIPPDAVISSSTSKVEEFLYVMRGTLEKTVNGKTIQLKAGDVIYLPEGTVHDAKAGPYGCELLAVITPAQKGFAESYEKNSRTIDIISSSEPRIVVDGSKLTPVISGNTEGPSWIGGRLYFSSQESGIFAFSPGGSCKLITKDMGTCGTTPLPNGNLAVCDLTNKRVIEITLDGSIVKVLSDSSSGLPPGNPNDIVSDKRGGLYVTVNDFDFLNKYSDIVVYISPEGKTTRLTKSGDLIFPNGLVLGQDGSRLYINSNDTIIWIYDVANDGSISNRKPFARLTLSDDQIGRSDARSFADGMDIDSRGNLFVTTAFEGVQVFGKTGDYIGTIKIPSTNLAFGGEDLKTLYITAEGKVYSLKMNAPGLRYPLR